jgi:enoyl-CoA hydratase/carnithine racemase
MKVGDFRGASTSRIELEVERTDRIEILRINRPEVRNAMNTAVRASIGLNIDAADADPNILAVVITGTGDRAFCAGADLNRIASDEAVREPTEADRRGLAAYQRFIRDGAAKPVIGAANGSAAGGGFELLLACDMVIAAEHATFGLPEVKRGLIPGSGGCHLGVRIPLGLALELCLTGDPIDAKRAFSLGLINRIVPSERVVDDALALARRVTANGPLAIRAAKRLVLTAARQSPKAAWRLQDEIQPAIVNSEDAREGARAFVEKRVPNWNGS